MTFIDLPEPGTLVEWRTETAPSAEGPWLLATGVASKTRWAFIPPGVTAFTAPDDRLSGWRAASWDADADVDLRGEPPAQVQAVKLTDVMATVRVGLRGWVRAEHRHALKHVRAAAERARSAGRDGAATRASELLAELEREDAGADDRFVRP